MNHDGQRGFHITAPTAVTLFCTVVTLVSIAWILFMGQHLVVGFAENNKPIALHLLLAVGFSPDERGLAQTTALHGAAVSGNVDILDSLINEETNIDAVDIHAQTPLFLAAFYGHPEAVHKFVNSGANLERKNGKAAQSALHIATIHKKYGAIKALLEYDFDINIQDIHGATPLHEATNKDDVKSVKLLLEAGASKTIKMGNGMTPLMFAKQFRKEKVIPLLAEEGR